MIVALAILAALMTLCGAAALVSGWDVVLTERGWTQVIAGATGLTGGLLLIGLTCVVAELKRLRREIISAVLEPEVPPAPPAKPLSRALGDRPEMDRIMAGTAEMVMSASAPADDGAASDSDPGKTAQAGDDAPVPPDEPRRTEDAFGAAPIDPSEPEPAPAEPADLPGGYRAPGAFAQALFEAAPSPSDPHVIGTHVSAGITYYMFSDDSIEAEMEQGRVRFENMDALRQFLETGEGGMRLTRMDRVRSERES